MPTAKKTKKPKKQALFAGFETVSKETIKAYVGHLFTFVGRKYLSFQENYGWASRFIFIDNKSKTLTGLVLDEYREYVKVLLDDSRVLWTKKTSLMRLLIREDKPAENFKQVLAAKIEELSKPDSQGLSISDTKELLAKCLVELNHSERNLEKSST